MQIIDQTQAHWITCFQNVAEKILGKSAEELGNMIDLEVCYGQLSLGVLIIYYVAKK